MVNLEAKLAHSLSDKYCHYNVNKLMMKTDLDKWLKYRKSQYDKLLRQRAPALYKQLSALSAKQATVIMLDNLLMVISFVRVCIISSRKRECS